MAELRDLKFLDLAPARRAAGTVRLPGSKSISNRALLLAGLARGTTELAGLLDADDTQVMLAALALPAGFAALLADAAGAALSSSPGNFIAQSFTQTS